MAKCGKCGKGGLFSKTNLGLCQECYYETYVAPNNNVNNLENNSNERPEGNEYTGGNTGSYITDDSMNYIPPVKKPFYTRPWFIVICIMFAFFVIGSIMGGGNEKEVTQTTNTSSNTNTTDSETATSETTPVEPELTVSQEQAIRKAEEYLRALAFSKKGLISQLEYEGFSKKDATFAVNNITVDWNEEAAKKAKEYLNSSSFSKKGLIEQLEYEGFTKKQAEYGTKSVGL